MVLKRKRCVLYRMKVGMECSLDKLIWQLMVKWGRVGGGNEGK